MKILLAGPGTGKTTKVKSIIKNDFPDLKNILVLSFTNATVNDLNESFSGFNNVSCSTLHAYALKINHYKDLHILDPIEIEILNQLANKLDVDFITLCDQLGCITFENMIAKCTAFLKSNPVYAKEVIGKIDLFIVDEFQDFNEHERELVYLISNISDHTFIMGDDDQSIYGFKDADPNGIIDLYNDKNLEKIGHENKCWRCPDKIVDACTNLLAKNRNRIQKEWHKTNKDGMLCVKQIFSQNESDNLVIDLLDKIIERDPKSSTLILSPVKYSILSLREKLNERGPEYIDFWKEKLGADTLNRIWWMRAIFGYKKLLSLLFVSKGQKLFQSEKFIGLLKKSLQEGFDEDSLSDEITSMKKFSVPLAKYLKASPSLDDFFKENPDFHEFKEYLDSENIKDSLKNLFRLLNPNKEFEKGKIHFMSIHKSKGLQAEYVILLGLVSGVLPNNTKGLDSIEAQRRLLFVGMTRALKNLYILGNVEWEPAHVHKLDKTQFKWNYKKKNYMGKMSSFVEELN